MKNLFFSLFLLLGLTVQSQESTFQFGVGLSPEVSYLLESKNTNFNGSLDSYISQPGFDFNAGFSGRYFFRERLSSSFGVFFQTRHYNISEHYRFGFNTEVAILGGIDQGFIAPNEDQVVLNVLAFPINLEFWLNESWHIFSGIRLKKILKKKRKQEFGDTAAEKPFGLTTDAEVKEIPIGVNFGFGKQFIFQKTALQISYQSKVDFNKIKNTSLDVSKLQFSTGIAVIFWFNHFEKTVK